MVASPVSVASASAARDDRDTQTDRLLRGAQDEGARVTHMHERAVLINIPLARGLARTFANRGIDREDLDQVAMLGLCKAVRGYRPSEGHPFSAYAVPTILGELRRHFRDVGWLVRPSRCDQEVGLAVRRAEEDLTQLLGRVPTRAEIAARLQRSTVEVSRALHAQHGYRATSLDAPGPYAPESAYDHVPDPDDPFARVEDRVTLAELVSDLPEREQVILRLRFHDELTQAEIGARVGLSQMQISRIIAATLSRLRAALTSADPQLDQTA